MPLGVPIPRPDRPAVPPSGPSRPAIPSPRPTPPAIPPPQSQYGREGQGDNYGPPAPWTTDPNYQPPTINGLGGVYGPRNQGPPAPAGPPPQISYWGTTYPHTNPLYKQYVDQLGSINQQYAADSLYNTSLKALSEKQYTDRVGFANKNSGLDRQALDVGKYQDVNLAGQRAQQAYATAQSDHAARLAQIEGMVGLSREERAEKLRAAQQAHDDIVTKLQANFGFNVNDLNAAATRDQRGNLSSASGRGATGSKGFIDARSDIANQLSANLSREFSNKNLGIGGAGSDLTASNNATEIAFKGHQAQIEAQRAESTRAAEQARLDKENSDKYLASVAEQYGIRNAQAAAALEQGLNSLGYDAAETTAALANAQASADASRAAQAAALTASALQIGMNVPQGASKSLPKPAPTSAPAPKTPKLASKNKVVAV